ncbi:uncharacterized protein [Narcine bancroftii]|uniref:uncharacterized protein isoform X2 n=1 Tax=Narcine bancroftii TaxID=1343680 RepID=UPI0038312EB2
MGFSNPRAHAPQINQLTYNRWTFFKGGRKPTDMGRMYKLTALDSNLISEEKYINHKLTSHCTKVLERLNSQRSKGVFCDVTLIVEETSYPAHRAVLAAVSEYFQDLFSEKGSTSNKIVDLKGFSSKSFLPLLEFSYTSSLSVKPDYFAETSALARHLRIWEVVEMCATLCKLHGTGNSKAHKEEASKEEKKDFSSYEVCIDQSFTGRTQQMSDIYYRFGQLEDGPAQQRLDNFGRNVFSSRSHSPVIQGETKGPDFTFNLQELHSGHFKDKMASAYSESSIGSRGVETLENSSRKFKLLGFYDKTQSKMLVKSVSRQRCSSTNKARSDIPTTLDLKFADKSRNVYNQRKCNLEKTLVNSISSARVSKHLDHNIADPQDNSSCKGASTLRSPVKQMATEEELYSPNTSEKYKLLSVLGLQRKTSVTDGEEQASWKQKRRLRQPKVRNYSFHTATKKKRIVCAKSQLLHQDQIKTKGLADCFVVIEKILPPVQKQKQENQLNKALFALKKSEPLNSKISLSQDYTGGSSKTQMGNLKAKMEDWNRLHDKKIQQISKCNSHSANCSLTKKSQCQKNSSTSAKSVKNDKLSVTSKTQIRDSKGTEGSPLTRNTRKCASYDKSVKCPSLRGRTTAKKSICLTGHGHSERRTRQSSKSMVDCRECKLKNLDYKPSRSQNAPKSMSKTTLLKNKPMKDHLSLEGRKFRDNQKQGFDDICVVVPSKSKRKQVVNENLLNQLPAKTKVGNTRKVEEKYGEKHPVDVCRSTSGAGKEKKAATQLDRRALRNEQPNSSELRCKQTKKQKQAKSTSKDSEKHICITSSVKQQVKKKVKSTGCRSLDAVNQDYLHCIKTPVLGKRKRIPTKKIIEAGFSFGFLVSSQKKNNMKKLPVQTKSKHFDLSPSLIRNCATETKVHAKTYSEVTTSNELAAIKRQNCNSTGPSFGQRKLTCSEVSEMMKQNVVSKRRRMKPVVLYGKKLINLDIKNTLGKKGTKQPNVNAKARKKDTQLSTSQKTIKLREVVSAGSKFKDCKSLPKNLRGAAQILKKVQSNFKEMLKLTPRRKYIAVESMKTTKVSRAHRCYECSATFTNCDSLFMHRIKHTKGKRWPCLLCDKSFYCLKNIQVHLRSHREKLYRCKLCVTASKKSKSFQSKR